MKITDQMVQEACKAMYLTHPVVGGGAADAVTNEARAHNMRNALEAGIAAASAQALADSRDQTFQRVCVARDDPPYSPVIYVHPENGSLTRDVIEAQGFLSKNCDAGLKKTMEFAQKTHPGGLGWKYCRVLWKVIPFAEQSMVESLIAADIRRTAERKLKGAGLTADEMASLGL